MSQPDKQPDLRLATPRCPECAEPAESVLETLLGDALLTPDDQDPQGFHYAGETLVDWNSQAPVRGPWGTFRLRCPNGHGWDSHAVGARDPTHLEKIMDGYIRSFGPWLVRYAEEALACGALTPDEREEPTTLPARALLSTALKELAGSLEPEGRSERLRFRRQATDTYALTPTPDPPGPV